MWQWSWMDKGVFDMVKDRGENSEWVLSGGRSSVLSGQTRWRSPGKSGRKLRKMTLLCAARSYMPGGTLEDALEQVGKNQTDR